MISFDTPAQIIPPWSPGVVFLSELLDIFDPFWRSSVDARTNPVEGTTGALFFVFVGCSLYFGEVGKPESEG